MSVDGRDAAHIWIWRFFSDVMSDTPGVYEEYETMTPVSLSEMLAWTQRRDDYFVLRAYGMEVAVVERMDNVWNGRVMVGVRPRLRETGTVLTMEEAKRLTYEMAVQAIENDEVLRIWNTGEPWEKRKARFERLEEERLSRLLSGD